VVGSLVEPALVVPRCSLGAPALSRAPPLTAAGPAKNRDRDRKARCAASRDASALACRTSSRP